MDYYDILLAKKLSGGSGSATLIDKNINENGTYNASSDNADGYKKVIVNVPIPSANYDPLIDRSISGALSTSVTKIGSYSLYNCSGLTSVTAPNCTLVSTYAFNGCTGLTYLVLPSCNTLDANAIRACSNLVAFDFNGNKTTASIGSNCFLDDAKLNMVVIRNTERVAPLGNTSAFNGTPFASGGTGGTLYVPNSLLSSYQSATNWSTVLGRSTNSIKSIESTHTDPDAPIDLTLYYADGTLIS